MSTPALKIPASFEEAVADPRIGAAPPSLSHQPDCDGGPWPESGAAEAVPRQQIEFLAIYTHLNRLHAHLSEIRVADGPEEEARPVVASLQRIIHFRDLLEDRYAPIGFYAEPVMDGALAVNLIFHYAQKYVQENHRRNEPISISLKVTLPENREEFASEPGISMETILADLQWPHAAKGFPPISKTG